MAGIYYNQQPGTGLGGAVTRDPRYNFDPRTVSDQAQGGILPPWVIPGVAGAGAAATGLGIWAMRRAGQSTYVPKAYPASSGAFNPGSFNVGYGNGLGTPPAMTPTPSGLATQGNAITGLRPTISSEFQTAELLNTQQAQAAAQRLAAQRSIGNPMSIGSSAGIPSTGGEWAMDGMGGAQRAIGPQGAIGGAQSSALGHTPAINGATSTVDSATMQALRGGQPLALNTGPPGSGFALGDAGAVSSAARPAVSYAELGAGQPLALNTGPPGAGFDLGEAGTVTSASRPITGSMALEPYLGGAASGAADAAGASAASPGFWSRLKSNALLRNTAPDAMAEGMGAAPALTGAARAKSYAGMAGKGLARGFGGMAIIGTANQLADALPVGSNARPGVRSMGNVAGATMMMPIIGGLGSSGSAAAAATAAQAAGAGGVGAGMASAALNPTTAALLGVPLAEGFSRTGAGNEVINAGRNASDNTWANLAANAVPLLQAEQIGSKLSSLFGGGDGRIDLSNRTDSTVFDIFGGEGGGAQAMTPEQQQQRIAQTSPDALMKVTTDYGLSPEMSAKLVDNYRKSMVLAQAQGGIPLQVGADGKLSDGTLAKDKPGVRAVTDAQGKTSYVSSDPADIQEAVYTRSLQEIPLLAQQQSQEEDYMRKQALMQAQLEEAIPQYFGGASWAADPTAQMLAAASIRDIPSRYVQAQSMQTQQGINSQIEQAQIQQMLAQQYPELFGRQSSSQPATLDAAINNG
jgi:hypothetical protein